MSITSIKPLIRRNKQIQDTINTFKIESEYEQVPYVCLQVVIVVFPDHTH